MSEPKMIKARASGDFFLSQYDPIPLLELIEQLKAIADSLPDAYQQSATAEIVGEGGTLLIEYERPETDTELAKRLAEEKAEARADEEYNRSLYLRLKAKFEPS